MDQWISGSVNIAEPSEGIHLSPRYRKTSNMLDWSWQVAGTRSRGSSEEPANKGGPRDADRNRNGRMMHAGVSLRSSFVSVCIQSAALPRMCSARRNSGCLHLRFFPSIRSEPDIYRSFHQAAERKDVTAGGIKES